MTEQYLKVVFAGLMVTVTTTATLAATVAAAARAYVGRAWRGGGGRGGEANRSSGGGENVMSTRGTTRAWASRGEGRRGGRVRGRGRRRPRLREDGHIATSVRGEDVATSTRGRASRRGLWDIQAGEGNISPNLPRRAAIIKEGPTAGAQGRCRRTTYCLRPGPSRAASSTVSSTSRHRPGAGRPAPPCWPRRATMTS